MRTRSQLLAILLLSLPPAVHAATSPPGVNLRWDGCYGDGGLMYRTFACDTNAGNERLVMSLELAEPMQDVSSIEFGVTLESASPSLPEWWNYRQTATCRQFSLSFSTIPPSGSVTCTDWGSGQAVGGIGSYSIGFDGPDRARLVCAVAVPSNALVDLQASVEYFVGSILIDHQKTVGTGACGGCSVPVCLAFDVASLNSSTGDRLTLTRGANWSGSQIVGWQGGYTVDFVPSTFYNGAQWPAYFDCVPYDVTRSTRSTWGAVKSLYR